MLVGLGVISWLVTRWRVEGGDLRIETGLLRRSSSRFPLRQIQAIDTVRPVLARIFGLAELRLRMGSTSGSGRLAYMTVREAERLRARSCSRSPTAAGRRRAASARADETVLVAVPPRRLICSILLTRLGLTVEALGVILVVAAVVSPAAAAGVIGASTAGHLRSADCVLAAGERRVQPDRRRGLGRAAPARRAARDDRRDDPAAAGCKPCGCSSPCSGGRSAGAAWRPTSPAASARRARTGRRAASCGPSCRSAAARRPARLLARIIADPPAGSASGAARPPAKSPLRYHHLAWGHTERCVVTTTGRITRTTAWVPLAKVQSLRRVQGPAQRRLGLATVHLDTAGRNIRAALRDRETAEADQALWELTALCRAARQDLRGQAASRA